MSLYKIDNVEKAIYDSGACKQAAFCSDPGGFREGRGSVYETLTVPTWLNLPSGLGPHKGDIYFGEI